MTIFNIIEKEQILHLLQGKIPAGFSLNDNVDLQLDNHTYQAFTITNDKIKILYLLINTDPLTNIHEENIGRLCKKYDFAFGHYVKCISGEKGIDSITVSTEIDRLN